MRYHVLYSFFCLWRQAGIWEQQMICIAGFVWYLSALGDGSILYPIPGEEMGK